MHSRQAITERLPDLPRWVEVRDLLLYGGGEVSGVHVDAGLSLVIRDPATGLVFVVGTPDAPAVHAAVAGLRVGAGVIAPEERTAAWLPGILPGWTPARIVLHLLGGPLCVPPTSGGEVAFLDPPILDRVAIHEELREELRSAARRSPIAATFAGGSPVSFCYAGSVTETLWDVSIDTVPDHRRQGHAAVCAAHMIGHMHARGKQPVWAALETNPASWRLALKLGFTAVDEITLFEPGAPAGSPAPARPPHR